MSIIRTGNVLIIIFVVIKLRKKPIDIGGALKWLKKYGILSKRT